MSYNFTIQDHSPFLQYFPYADGVLTNGWQPYYAASGFLTAPGTSGVGESYHATSAANASMNLQFYGTGFYLYGYANASYSVILDNVLLGISSSTPGSDLLYFKTNLAPTTHYVSLSALPSDPGQQLYFDRAIVAAPSNAGIVQAPTPVVSNNMNQTALTYSGGWNIGSAEGVPNKTISLPYHETKVKGSTVSMSFEGAVAVAVSGMSNWGNWVYSVTLDGVENTRNGSTFSKVPDSLLFYQAGLDSTKTHTINVTNVSDDMNLALNSITVYYQPGSSATSSSQELPTASASSSPAPMHHKSSVSLIAIIGPIAGALLLLTIAVLFWCLRRRRKLPPGVSVVKGSKFNHNVLLEANKRRTYAEPPPRPFHDLTDPFANPSPSPLTPVYHPEPARSIYSQSSRSTARLHDEPVVMAWDSTRGRDPSRPWNPSSRSHSRARSPTASQSSFSVTTDSFSSPRRGALPTLPSSSSNSSRIYDNKRVLQLMNDAEPHALGKTSAYNGADIEMLLRVIAERMDPEAAHGQNYDDPSTPPPEYRG